MPKSELSETLFLIKVLLLEYPMQIPRVLFQTVLLLNLFFLLFEEYRTMPQGLFETLFPVMLLLEDSK